MKTYKMTRILLGILTVLFLLTVAIQAKGTSPFDKKEAERAYSDLLRVATAPTLYATTIEQGDFKDPLIFDFSDLADETHLGPGYPNPYEDDGIEFTGVIATYDFECISGRELDTAYSNDPAEPFVGRVRILNPKGARRVGACVWGQCFYGVSLTAYDDAGLEIASAVRDDCPGPVFMALETPSCEDRPIRYVEWRGLPGADADVFPVVDNVMIELCNGNGCPYKIQGDLNDDCVVNINDIALLLDCWLVNCYVDSSDPCCVPK